MTKFGTLTKEGKIVNSMTIDLSKVKSNDPLAYSYGYFHGKSGNKMAKPQKGDKLASEYIKGYKQGRKEYKKEKLKRGNK